MDTSSGVSPLSAAIVIWPAAATFYWVSYSLLLPPLCKWLIPASYASFNRFNSICFRQNINSAMHSCIAVVTLVLVLASNHDVIESRLGRSTSTLLYVDICLSLGYFSFALPASIHMTYVLKAGLPYASPSLVFHHVLVMVAQITFIVFRQPQVRWKASAPRIARGNAPPLPPTLCGPVCRVTSLRLASYSS